MTLVRPDVVDRLILLSALGWLPWPDRRKRLAAHVTFAPTAQHMTWATVGMLARLAPGVCLRMMLRDLSTEPASLVMTALDNDDRTRLLTLFTQMRSGRGFHNDLRPIPDATAGVGQPTLVIATRKDGSVPFAHAQSLASAIRNAELVESQADSHFIWLGPHWSPIANGFANFSIPVLAPMLDRHPRVTNTAIASVRSDPFERTAQR
jgi:pimeloyl-ACP methyl ester carboxylesterase